MFLSLPYGALEILIYVPKAPVIIDLLNNLENNCHFLKNVCSYHN
jgi:hypothetical protein